MKANEQLAAYAHEAWASWAGELLKKSTRNDDGSVTIPREQVEQWSQQLGSYAELPEGVKQLARIEAIKIMRIFLGDPDED